MSSRRRAAAGVPSTIGAPAAPAAAPPPADAHALVDEAVRFHSESRPGLRAALERFGELELGKGYEIVGAPLGVGTYGSVRRVEFTVPERLRPDEAPAPASWRVRGAVKVPHGRRAARDDAFEAVLEGATAVAALQALAGGARYEPFARAAAAAPIVRVFGWLPLPDGRVGVVMEELAGSLASYIAGPLFAAHYPDVAARAGYARYVARRLLDALGALRAAGFHHCDLKAQNVGLRGDGTSGPPEPALIDFGSAKDAGLPMDRHYAQTLLLPACVRRNRLDPAARPPVFSHPCACSETVDAVNLLAIAQDILLAGAPRIERVGLCTRYAGMLPPPGAPGAPVAGVDAPATACLDELPGAPAELRTLVEELSGYGHLRTGPLGRLAEDPWFRDAPLAPPAPAQALPLPGPGAGGGRKARSR